MLFRGVWYLRDACELVWWFETRESGLGEVLKLHLASWEHPESGLGEVLKLHVASWEVLEDLLEALGNVLGSLKLILEVS